MATERRMKRREGRGFGGWPENETGSGRGWKGGGLKGLESHCWGFEEAFGWREGMEVADGCPFPNYLHLLMYGKQEVVVWGVGKNKYNINYNFFIFRPKITLQFPNYSQALKNYKFYRNLFKFQKLENSFGKC